LHNCIASKEQHHDTWLSWQRPSAAPPVVACGRRHLPISSCQLHVDQQSAIARSPLLAREHGTVDLLLSSPLRIQHLQKDLKSHLFGLSFSLWQLCTLTMYSALVVYTAYCALQIVRLTLHTLQGTCRKKNSLSSPLGIQHLTRVYNQRISTFW